MYLLSVWDVSQPGISKHGRFLYNYSVGYRINWVGHREVCHSTIGKI